MKLVPQLNLLRTRNFKTQNISLLACLDKGGCTLHPWTVNWTVKSSANLNFTKNPFKSTKTHLNAYTLLAFYIVDVCLYSISKLIFSKSASAPLYVCVRLLRQDCPVQFTVHRCTVGTEYTTKVSHGSDFSKLYQ